MMTRSDDFVLFPDYVGPHASEVPLRLRVSRAHVTTRKVLAMGAPIVVSFLTTVVPCPAGDMKGGGRARGRATL